MKNNIPLSKFIDQDIPQEILDQLNVIGRVSFPLKKTRQSAVSTPVEELTEEQQFTADKFINHVKEMERKVKTLEDYFDLLTKDMKIKPTYEDLSNAAKLINGNGDDNITQETLYKALSILDMVPIFAAGGDPVLGALTGNHVVTGPMFNCNEITRGIASSLKAQKNSTPNTINSASKINEEFSKKQKTTSVELMNILVWNHLWARFFVMFMFINPLKRIISPIRPGFVRRKLRKVIDKIARFLLCKVPKTMWKRYNPPPEYRCGSESDCVKKDTFDDSDNSTTITFDSTDDGEICINTEDLIKDSVKTEDENLGMPPECAQNAKLIVDAVINDALTTGESIDSSTLQNVNTGGF